MQAANPGERARELPAPFDANVDKSLFSTGSWRQLGNRRSERAMRIDKNLVVIGLSDDDTAHLRLLLRKAGDQLRQRWRWGSEEGADLVVVDTNAFAGQMARTRATAAGMRVAVITDDPAASDQELRLHRPLKLPNVVEVFNTAGGGLVLAPQIESGSDDLYLEFVRTPSSKLDPPDTLMRLFEEDADAAALGFGTDAPPPHPDSLFRRDEQAHRPRYSVPLTLDEDTRIERTSGSTPRSEARAFEVGEALARQGAAPGPNTLPPVKRGSLVVDGSRHALVDYLHGNLLAGPAQIQLDGDHGVEAHPALGPVTAQAQRLAPADHGRVQSDTREPAGPAVSEPDLAAGPGRFGRTAVGATRPRRQLPAQALDRTRSRPAPAPAHRARDDAAGAPERDRRGGRRAAGRGVRRGQRLSRDRPDRVGAARFAACAGQGRT
ncbi:MAG: hypothetical protein ABT27_14460 [Lysobacteraceae bacterium SCN 69-25]|nr:MAG: hypothetical protein ABT27_14460 [Xanthomonadaceae bacterium SCN 69-25]